MLGNAAGSGAAFRGAQGDGFGSNREGAAAGEDRYAGGWAFGSVWIFDGTTKRLLRVSPDSETVSEVPRPIGFGDLLGADVAGWLWFSSMSGIVKAGEPLPVWRWNPQTGEQRQVALPTN